jgi:hypothetical protein
MDLFKYHHGPKVTPQSPTSRGKTEDAGLSMLSQPCPLSNKDGTAISRTGNNSLLNNRRGEGKYEMIRAI